MRATRRDFLKGAGATALGAAGASALAAFAPRAHASPVPDGFDWGEPVPDPNLVPVLDLPPGFSYRVLLRRNDRMSDGIRRPGLPDLNIALPRENDEILLVTSHEILWIHAIFDFLNAFNPAKQTPILHRRGDRPTSTGGCTATLLDRNLDVIETNVIASDMMGNCSGGPTPWGTVLTGEENSQWVRGDGTRFGYGYIYEVDPTGNSRPVRIPEMGRFSHEGAAVDPETGIVYLTEDDRPACLYRFVPDTPDWDSGGGHLDAGGVLQAFVEDPRPGWVDIDRPAPQELELDQLPWNLGPATAIINSFLRPDQRRTARQGLAKGARRFARLEGIRYHDGGIYFAETAIGCGRVWRFDISAETLTIVAEGADGPESLLCMPDNLAIHPTTHAIAITEDKDDTKMRITGANRIMVLTPDGDHLAPLGVVRNGFEPTGVEWSPNGNALFVNIMGGPDLTLAIEGPFPT